MALFEENVFEFYMHLLQNINRSENKKFLHLMLETVYLLFHRDSPADLVTAHQDALTSKVRNALRPLFHLTPCPAEQRGLSRAQNTSCAREEVQRVVDQCDARCATSTLWWLFRHHEHGRPSDRNNSSGDSPPLTSQDGSKSIKNKSVQRILPRDVLPKPLTNPRGRKRLASDVAPQSSSRVQVILKGVGEQIIEYCYNGKCCARV